MVQQPPTTLGFVLNYCKMFKLTAWECLVSVVTGNDCWYFAMICLTCKCLKLFPEFYFYLLLTHGREAVLLATGICLFLVSVVWIPSACSFSPLKWRLYRAMMCIYTMYACLGVSTYHLIRRINILCFILLSVFHFVWCIVKYPTNSIDYNHSFFRSEWILRKSISLHFFGPEGSLLHSQESTTSPCPDSD